MCFECIALPRFTAVPLAEIWSHERSGGHSEIMLFILPLKNIFKFSAEGVISQLRQRFRSFPLFFLPPTPLVGITSPTSSRPTSFPRPPPPPPSLALAPVQRDHMLANGLPGWVAWRLEGSLVDPPISPGPRPRRSGARPAVHGAP